ncbi:MAG: TerB family tellurite resistance protein [Myxococcota bacterium]|nr:TerB family tellurite resistance protein [Myxococcota bacterium]
MLSQLTRSERLRLVRFVCSFAWADLEIKPAERDFIQDLIRRLDLDDEETARVEGWLSFPPAPEEVDPMEIPVEHRKVFLDTMLALVAADGELAEAETESFNLLSQLVR